MGVLPSTFTLPDGYIAERLIFFLDKERLIVEIGSCWRVVFLSNLAIKSRLRVGFRNSWRCSNVVLLQELYGPKNAKITKIHLCLEAKNNNV